MRPAPEGQQRVRVVAQRGKSMEELGISKHTRPLALSKSTEQLDQLLSRSARPGGMLGLDREKRSMSLFRESLREKAQGQEGERGKQLWSEAERARQGQENIDQNNAQGQTQNQTQKNLLLKQDSTPLHSSEDDAGPLTTAGIKDLSRSSSPVSSSVSRARVHSGSPGSQRAATDELRLSRPSSEASNPPSPRSQETSARQVKSTSAKPNQTKLSHENRPSTR